MKVLANVGVSGWPDSKPCRLCATGEPELTLFFALTPWYTPIFTPRVALFIKTKYTLRSLGDPKKGITLVRPEAQPDMEQLKLIAPLPFEVWFDPELGVVQLRNHEVNFSIMKQDGKHYLEMWGHVVEFEPFLRLPWMEWMLSAPKARA